MGTFNVARLETGHTPSRQKPEYWDGDIPWLGIKDATNNHGKIINDTYQHCSQLGIDNSSARVLPANTVCLSRTASVGYVVIMSRPMATSQDFVNWVCTDAIDFRYLASILIAEKESLFQFARGTTHQTIYFPEVKAFHVCLPPIEQQKQIADIIWSLNEKIDLNCQINQTLEQIAQTIFKSWFVDFQPVKAKIEAKAAGRDPERAAMCAISGKLEPQLDQLPPEQHQQLAATAALFPDELVESKLGLIPQRWEVGSVYDVSDVIYGAPFASAKFNSDGVGKPLIRIRDLKDESPGVFTPEVHPKGFMVQPGDIVVGMDGEFRAYLWGGEEAWLNQRVCVFKPKSSVPAALVRNSIMPRLAAVEASETATTVIHLGKNDIDRFRIVVPELNVMEKFGAVVDPLYAQIVSLKQSSRALASLRDTLLPKLLSGELTVDNLSQEATA